MNSSDSINAIKIVTDSITITLDEIDFLTKRKCNKIKTELKNVPFSQGALAWSVYCIPCYDKDYVSVYLNVTAPTNVKGTWSIGNSAIQENFDYRYESPGIMGNNKFVHHKFIIPHFVDKKLSITCTAKFDVIVPWDVFQHNLFSSCAYTAVDFTFMIGNDSVKAHKQLLSFVSPVFMAMFSHDTYESKSSTVVIKDFDFETIRTAMDFIYGRKVEDPSMETIVGVLRFGDKYNINCLTQFRHIPRCNLSLHTFAPILHYAYDFSKQNLLQSCYKFFKNYHFMMDDAKGLSDVPSNIIVNVMKTIFGLDDVADVLRQAYFSSIEVIIDPIERYMVETLTIDTFCNVAECAWDYYTESEYLQKACAAFLNQNWMDITHSAEFLSLNSEIIKYVMIEANQVVFNQM